MNSRMAQSREAHEARNESRSTCNAINILCIACDGNVDQAALSNRKCNMKLEQEVVSGFDSQHHHHHDQHHLSVLVT